MDVYENLDRLGLALSKPTPKGGIYTPIMLPGNLPVELEALIELK